MEILVMTSTIRDCVRDRTRLDEIGDLIEEGREVYGSQSFDQHLTDLVKSGAVEFDVAKAAANNPADFDLKMNMFNDPRTQRAGSGQGGTSSLADEMTTLMGG
jgi:twitching motility protein PilT